MAIYTGGSNIEDFFIDNDLFNLCLSHDIVRKSYRKMRNIGTHQPSRQYEFLIPAQAQVKVGKTFEVCWIAVHCRQLVWRDHSKVGSIYWVNMQMLDSDERDIYGMCTRSVINQTLAARVSHPTWCVNF